METPPDSITSDKTRDGVAAEVRRPRAILSCVACRDRKLKCDRGRPCNNCTRRHLTCRYFSSSQSSKKGTSRASTASELNSRLQHLEDLLVVLNNQQGSETHTASPTGPQRPTSDTRDLNDVELQGSVRVSPGPSQLEASDRSAGSIFKSRGGTTYVEGNHWQAILDDIADVREFLQQHHASDSLPPRPSENSRPQGPALLFGGAPSFTRKDIIASFPPRATVDRLVARFFNSGEPALMLIHVPTFLKEYEGFWTDPHSAPMAWLGLLYSMLCMSIFFHARSGHPLPSSLDTGSDLIEYQARAAQCIRQSDYTKAGKYKLEALLTYLATEYFVTADAQLATSICLSIIIRLAMHMGIHQDSERFTNISIFEGEMRRRAWAVISQVERLTSFQLGLPSMVDRTQCSTKSPHNYQDADIHEDMTSLPPERPESERTICSYTIAKDRVMNAFGDIIDSVCGNVSPAFDSVLQLDIQLENARSSLPSFLQMRPLSASFTDPAELIMQRYNIELLYLKARCVLHRQYMTQSTNNPAYAGSRSICVDSAKRTLRHQSDIHLEAQPGGQLYQDRWFISSLTTSDFLLAAMILCLETSRRVFESKDTPAAQIMSSPSSQEIVNLLEHSRHIWLENATASRDAGSASDAIGHMLKKVAETVAHASSVTKSRQLAPDERSKENCRLATATEKAKATTTTVQNNSMATDISTDHSTLSNKSGAESTLQGFQEYLEADGFDWQSWDMAIMQNETNAERLLMDMPGSMEDIYAGIEQDELGSGVNMTKVGLQYERNWN